MYCVHNGVVSLVILLTVDQGVPDCLVVVVTFMDVVIRIHRGLCLVSSGPIHGIRSSDTTSLPLVRVLIDDIHWQYRVESEKLQKLVSYIFVQ